MNLLSKCLTENDFSPVSFLSEEKEVPTQDELWKKSWIGFTFIARLIPCVFAAALLCQKAYSNDYVNIAYQQ